MTPSDPKEASQGLKTRKRLSEERTWTRARHQAHLRGPREIPGPELSIADKCWLAGLLEGEGCFSILSSEKNRYRYPRVQMSSVDRDVVERAARLMGCPSVKIVRLRHTERQQQYHCTLVGRKAVWFMRVMKPLFGKRRQARITELLYFVDEQYRERLARYAA